MQRSHIQRATRQADRDQQSGLRLPFQSGISSLSSATVEVSDDGKQFNEVATTPFSRQLPETGRKAFTDSITFSPIQATYVRLTLRNGGVIRNGIDCRRDTPEEIIQADLYIDEIEVY